jgi:hypothetical protein
MAGDARIGECVVVSAWNALAVPIGILNALVAVIPVATARASLYQTSAAVGLMNAAIAFLVTWSALVK